MTTTTTPTTGNDWLPSAAGALLAGAPRGVLVSGSKDPDAKLTFVATTGTRERVAVKVPTTPAASLAVEAEGRMLVAMRRLPLGALLPTVPRYVASYRENERTVLVSTLLDGRPMSGSYHTWLHTSRPAAVRQDFRVAGTWLRGFQWSTSGTPQPVSWAAEIADQVARRWDGHPDLPEALARLMLADQRLRAHHAPTTAVHGDFWFGNLLVDGDRVTGVVDWEAGSVSGWPHRDLARFVLSYLLYLDRHTRPGHRVLGHPGLRREGFGAGIRYGLLSSGWMPSLVRSFLASGLEELGMPGGLWYDVALTGVADVAATANDDDFGAGHLSLLASLPARARRLRGSRS